MKEITTREKYYYYYNPAGGTPTPKYTVTASISMHGLVTPSTQEVSEGQYANLSLRPEYGYDFTDVLINGASLPVESLPKTGSLSVGPIVKDTSVSVKFNKVIASVTYTGSAEESLTMAGSGKVMVRWKDGTRQIITLGSQPQTITHTSSPSIYSFVEIIDYDNGAISVFGSHSTEQEPKTSITAVDFPDSVTEIPDYAFNGEQGLKNVTIPSTVQKIGDHAFTADGLSVVCEGEPAVLTGSKTPFSLPETKEIIVPIETYDHYITNEDWNKYWDIIRVEGYYSIHSYGDDHSVVTPYGWHLYPAGSDQKFTFTPQEGFEVTKCVVDGTERLGSEFIFTSISSNHSITCVTETKKFTVTSSCTEGGSIVPAGLQVVEYDDDITFTIAPASGYVTKGLLIDGIASSPAETYTFTNVHANHTIHAVFEEKKTYTITVTQAAGGTITPRGPVEVEEGESVTFTITHGYEYERTKLIIDGKDEPASMTYTFSNVTADHTISAEYRRIPDWGLPMFFVNPSENDITIDIYKEGAPVHLWSLSNDNEEWTDPAPITSITVPANGKTGIRGTYTNTSNFDYLTFGTAAEVYCHGDVLSLIYGADYQTEYEIKDNYQYNRLFAGMSRLMTAPYLEHCQILKNYCFHEMFAECSSLGQPPELPAVDLTEGCYQRMFYRCSNLMECPHSTATGTMAPYCCDAMFSESGVTVASGIWSYRMAECSCREMFRDCPNLVSAAGMYFSELADSCCYGMFSGCPKLAYIDQEMLEATELANGCYMNMFEGCSSLTVAPILPAETLTDFCYWGMFEGCSSLNYIKCLATSISPSDSTYRWVAGVPEVGTFVKDRDFTGWGTPTQGVTDKIPYNWTIEDYPPIIKHTITVTQPANGSITPAGQIEVEEGESVMFTITPDEHFAIQELVIDGMAEPASDEYTFYFVSQDHTISAVMYQSEFTITATQADHGHITPEGVKTVQIGDSVIYSIVPDEGYRTTKLIIDGSEIDPQEEYMFTNVQSNHTISAAFEEITAYPFYFYNPSAEELTVTVNKMRSPSYSWSTSNNASTWSSASAITSISVPANGKTYLKGTYSGTSVNSGLYFNVINNYPVNIGGNIMSLCSGDNWETATAIPNDYQFYQLFSAGQISDISKLSLPATTLAPHCYGYMFYGCSGLTSIPSDLLPATTLAQYCYYEMFHGCSGLTSIPSDLLPAETLAPHCYSYMFRGCSGLTSIPSDLIHATTLAPYCYDNMFYYCTGLTSVPSDLLPATELDQNCYAYMFSGCSSMTTAPDLPATTLVQQCYGGMFQGCSSLNYIKCLATDISASDSTYRWVYGVPEVGTFVKAKGFSGWGTPTQGDLDHIPYNWTVETWPPAAQYTITVTQPANGTIDPAGPVTVEEGSSAPFTITPNTGYYVKNLIIDGVTVQGAETYTFTDVQSNHTITAVMEQETPASEPFYFENPSSSDKDVYIIKSGLPYYLWSTSTDGTTWSTPQAISTIIVLPHGRTYVKGTYTYTSSSNYLQFDCMEQISAGGNIMSLIAGDNYKTATTISEPYQFYQLLRSCQDLLSAPELPATTLSKGCYSAMFRGCTRLTAAPELPAETLVDNCYQNMFNSCSSLNYIKCLATNISATSCTTNWLSGVASTGDFYCKSSTSWTTGASGIPSRWTRHNV